MSLAVHPLVVAAFLWLVDATSGTPAEKRPFERPKVLLLSVGGFRMDYVEKADCPILKRFVANGTMAKYVQNSINTASLVNHYSIATGSYPESHGIVSSVMFDPLLKRIFKSDTRDDPVWWSNVHPVWQDNKGKSGVCRWPDVYGPLLPKLNCEGKPESFKDDIDRVLNWFASEDATLALMYVASIKKAAIKWGPQSSHVKKEIEIFDFLLGYLIQKIRDHDLEVDILITSDHGVAPLRWDHVIDLDNCIDSKTYILLNSQGTLLFYPKHGHSVHEVYKNLAKCHELHVHLKENLPSRYHYTHHPRIPPIIAFVPLGAVVRSSKNVHDKIDKVLTGSPGTTKDMGGAGYEPGNKLMKSVFFANGPSFRNGFKFPAIRNTDIYGLVCHLLQIPPRPNNGSFHEVKAMLSEFLSVVVKPTSSDVKRRPSGKPESDALFGDYEVRALFWFLVGSSCLMFLICAIGCFHSMWKNVHHGYYKSTKVFPPTGKQLLTTYSSDEED